MRTFPGTGLRDVPSFSSKHQRSRSPDVKKLEKMTSPAYAFTTVVDYASAGRLRCVGRLQRRLQTWPNRS